MSSCSAFPNLPDLTIFQFVINKRQRQIRCFGWRLNVDLVNLTRCALGKMLKKCNSGNRCSRQFLKLGFGTQLHLLVLSWEWLSKVKTISILAQIDPFSFSSKKCIYATSLLFRHFSCYDVLIDGTVLSFITYFRNPFDAGMLMSIKWLLWTFKLLSLECICATFSRLFFFSKTDHRMLTWVGMMSKDNSWHKLTKPNFC